MLNLTQSLARGMNQALVVPLIKLSLCSAVLIALIFFSIWPTDGEFRGLAAFVAIVLAGPVTLLVAIDVARVLRQQPLGLGARRVSMLPQIFLGGFACVGGIAMIVMSFMDLQSSTPLRLFRCLFAAAVITYGVRLIRNLPPFPASRRDSSRR